MIDIFSITTVIAIGWIPQDLISQYWFIFCCWLGLGAVSQHAITLTNVDQVLWRHMGK